MTRRTAQLDFPPPSYSDPSRFDRVGESEAAAIGRALLSQLKGEELTSSQRSLLARAKSESEADRRAPTPVVDASRTLLTLGRGSRAELRVRWRRYKGSSPFLDLRRFERGDRGELLATRQGVTLRAHEVDSLIETLQELKASMEEVA